MLEIDSINVLNDIHFKKGNSQLYNVDFTDFIIYYLFMKFGLQLKTRKT